MSVSPMDGVSAGAVIRVQDEGTDLAFRRKVNFVGAGVSAAVNGEAIDVTINGGAGSSAFADLTTGTNTTAAMTVGTGASIAASGSGTITATAVPVGGVSGLGTNVATALGVNVGSAGAVMVLNGALGTPSSGTLTNATGLPVGGISATGTPDNTTFLRGDGTWNTPVGGGGATLDGITAATADEAGISNGDFNIVWNWQKTTNSETAFTFGETAASTSGTSTSGKPNQVLLKLSTLAASTMSPLVISVRGAYAFGISPTNPQILAADGDVTNPPYSFAAATGTGLSGGYSGTGFTLGAAGTAVLQSSSTLAVFGIQTRFNSGTAAAPSPSVGGNTAGLFASGTNICVSSAGREMVRWTASSAGGGWQIMDEADSNPTTTELDATDSFAMYMKADKLVFAYNVAGTMNYLTIPLDGSSTAWTNGTTAP